MNFQSIIYPETDKKEVEAVSIFNDLIDKKYIKSIVNARDKKRTIEKKEYSEENIKKFIKSLYE